MSYLELARQIYEDGDRELDQVQTTALIAIAEELHATRLQAQSVINMNQGMAQRLMAEYDRYAALDRPAGGDASSDAPNPTTPDTEPRTSAASGEGPAGPGLHSAGLGGL